MASIADFLEIFGAGNTDILTAALEQLAEGVIVTDSAGKLVFVNSAAAEIHGTRQLEVEPGDYANAYRLLTPDGDPHPPEDLPLFRAVTKGETVAGAHWRIARPDGRLIDAVGSAKPVINADGKQIGAVLTLSDETEDMAVRRHLDAALAAKDSLLYEVNHRVKNNLAMVSSLLRIQSRKFHDETVSKAFTDVSRRVSVLAGVHQRLYETGSHNQMDVIAFVGEILGDTIAALSEEGAISLTVRTKGSAPMAIDRAVPLVLAINELALNSLKHAFADTPEPQIDVEMTAENGKLDVTYRDNGCGAPDGAAEPGTTGIGRVLIASLSGQLGAVTENRTDPDGFCMQFSMTLEGPEGDPAITAGGGD